MRNNKEKRRELKRTQNKIKQIRIISEKKNIKCKKKKIVYLK